MNNQPGQHNDIKTNGQRYDQVLISVANPQTAEQSVRLACRLTTPSSVLHIINVTTTVPFTERVTSWRKSSKLVVVMTQLANRLDRVAKPLAVTSGSIPDAIVNAANDIDANLIILGWFGQVTPIAVKKSAVVRKVLDKASCDTIVLQSRGNLLEIERIVVPIHENYSRKRLALAESLSQQHTTQIVLIHVLTPDSQSQEDDAQNLLEEPAERLGAAVETRVVSANTVVDGILSIVEEHDLVVVGPGREWVFSRFLFGHHADQLANRASCSVLMYRARGRKVTAWFLGLLKAIRQVIFSNSR